MTIEEKLTAIVDTLKAASVDAGKFDRGNASAGTRVRKAAQAAKGALQDLRVAVQEAKAARG